MTPSYHAKRGYGSTASNDSEMGGNDKESRSSVQVPTREMRLVSEQTGGPGNRRGPVPPEARSEVGWRAALAATRDQLATFWLAEGIRSKDGFRVD